MTGRILLALSCCILFGTSLAVAQKNELAAGIGGVFTPDTKCTASNPQCGVNQLFTFKMHPQIAFEAEAAHRIFDLPLISTYIEVPVVGIPARQVTIKSLVAQPAVPPDYSSIFFTPAIKFKFGAPLTPFKPFVSAGGGFAHYRISKQNNTGSTTSTNAVFQLGGGLDIASPIPFLAFRGEIREFFAGSPSFNGLMNSTLHNLYAGGALVLHF